MAAASSSTMAAPRVIFCEQCGSIMDEPRYAGEDVDCRVCGMSVTSDVFQSLVLQSASTEKAVEEELAEGAGRKKRTQTRAVIKEPCPKCLHPELEYYTMQLRSADEGQTVFCARC
jgi:DNA-directed RNA polymerase I subunit RPA12